MRRGSCYFAGAAPANRLPLSPTTPCARCSRRWLLVLRGVLGFCSVSSLFLAVSLLPLADASVLSFLSPLFVAALRWVLQHVRCSLGA